MIMRFEPYLGVILLCAACQPAVVTPDVSSDAPEAPQEIWDEIPDARISFVRMHPGAAQKNVYVDWKCYENRDTHARVYRVLGRDISEEAVAALDDLRKAAAQDLIPSDGLYACRLRENMPQFRLEFTQDSKKVQILSSSDCLHAAPFNLIVDGKHYIQVTGALGVSLEKALSLSGNALHVGETEGLFMFSEKIDVEGYVGAPQESPAKWYDTAFRKDEAFGAMLAAIESRFGASTLPEVACNQSKSPRCDEVSARYQIKCADGFVYTIPLKFDGKSVAAQLVPEAEWEALAKAVKSPVFRAAAQAISPAQTLQLTWSDGADCKMVKGLAKHFELPDTISCSTWTLHGKDYPAMIYYVGLDAMWYAPGSDLKSYFTALNQLQGKKRLSYSKYVSPGKSTNLFVRLNGRPIAFVTKNGKTTIE